MNQRPKGSCCGNCGAWLREVDFKWVETGNNEYGPIVAMTGHCHMLPNLVATLSSHFCFMWIEKEG